MRQKLVAAQIQGAHDDRQRLERGGGFAVRQILLLLARQVVVIQKKVFGAEQAHAFCAVGFNLFDIARLLDVGQEANAVSIQRDCRLAQDVLQRLLEGDLLENELAVFEERLIGRIDDDDAVQAIQQHVLAVFELAARVLQPHHRRNPQRPRHDGRMGGLAAHICGESEHVALIQLRRVGRRQVVADDNAGFLQVPKVGLLLEAEQVV